MSDRVADSVRFEVLGPLRVRRGETELSLGGLQQRVVLGVLLLHANRPLGRDAIVDAVWGSAAPAYAVNLLQRHVSQLRRALEPGRSGRAASPFLTWTEAGYLLTVPTDGVDLAVFDREIDRGRAARAAGDLLQAAKALNAALCLWRGPPFEGLTSPLLDAERDRLAERHVTAIEERLEIDLALGRHSDVVAELRHLIAENPLRERLRGMLMLALYRCGRQGEALAAFHEARRHLCDELGVEPGAQLQRIHQQMLAADPTLEAPPAVDSVPTRIDAGIAGPAPPPAQLPRGVPDFTGRDAELTRLRPLLESANSVAVIVAITGTAGVGKTALAVHWAHQICDRFPDGQLYVNLRGFDPTGSATEPAEAIRGFLDAFAVPPQRIPVSLDAQAALYRSLLAGRRVLVVLDNARSAEQVRPLLPGSPGCLVIVTSRHELTSLVAADGARPITLDLLTAAEAREFLARRLRRDRVDAEPQEVNYIIAVSARLPLALAIVAARAAVRPQFSLAVLADQLREASGDLAAFDGGEQTTDVRAVLSWSYRSLGADAARLFRLLGLHAGPDITTLAAASLAGLPVARVRLALAGLTQVLMVTERIPGRFAFHDLLRAYANDLAHIHDSEIDRRTAVHRVLDHYLHTANAATVLLNPYGDVVTPTPPLPGVTPADLADAGKALDWFSVEHAALVAAVGQAAHAGLDTHAWQLSCSFETYLDRRAHWHDQAATQHTALQAALRQADRTGEALARRGLARALAQLGRYEDAHEHLRRVLRLYGELGDAAGLARTHYALARVFGRQGRYRDALDHVQQALEKFDTHGDRAVQAAALNGVGWFHALLGNDEQALVHCEQALTMHREIGDHGGEARTLDSLGYAHYHLGHHDLATSCYRQAVALWRVLGDRYCEAETLDRLGDTHYAAGDTDSARTAWHQALTILEQFDHPDAKEIHAKLEKLNEDDRLSDE
jgi:DNA-binding SARP family transcriptional activator/Tfp pilus assembly protein PilF